MDRKGKSCLTQLLAHIDTVMEGISNDANADVLYLDFAKAFDKVDHQMLISKLGNIGIKGKLLAWITSFLSNRTQSVIVDGVHSEPTKVISGVPQGTVLGPLLFIIFINDIYGVVTSSHIQSFADDTRLTKIIIHKRWPTSTSKEPPCSYKMGKWQQYGITQTKIWTVTARYKNDLKGETSHQYTVSEHVNIAAKSLVEDLGVSIHESLKWLDHIQKSKKCQNVQWRWVVGFQGCFTQGIGL